MLTWLNDAPFCVSFIDINYGCLLVDNSAEQEMRVNLSKKRVDLGNLTKKTIIIGEHGMAAQKVIALTLINF